jgi:hypothetical protein
MLWLAGWVADRVSRISGGRMQLGSGNSYDSGRGSSDHAILDGTEDVDDAGVELDTR